MFLCEPNATACQTRRLNGKGSSSRCTKHLDVRYFFVTDKIKKGDIKISYCPTHDDRWFLHQASTRITICTYEEQDTKPAQRRKRHCAQECVGKIKSLNSNSNLKSNLGRTCLKFQIQKC